MSEISHHGSLFEASNPVPTPPNPGANVGSVSGLLHFGKA